MTLPADAIEALRVVRDLARAALESTGLEEVRHGNIRDVRLAYEGLRYLTELIGEGGPVVTPEGHLLTCVRLGTERGWSVEVDAEFRSVRFRRTLADGRVGSFRIEDILLGDEPIEAEVARVLDMRGLS